MKKIIFLLFAFLSFTYGVAVGTYQIFPFKQIIYLKNIVKKPAENTFVLDKIQFFEKFNNIDYNFVFIGDSITDRASWSEIFPLKLIANRGISGDTTNGVLNRIDSIFKTNAKTAFIMIGVNDVASDVPDIEIVDNYKNIIIQLQKNGMTVIVQSILYTSNKKHNDSIGFVNKEIRDFCTDKNIDYIDLNAIFAPNKLLLTNYSNDGVHLNGDAYYLWSKEISKYMY